MNTKKKILILLVIAVVIAGWRCYKEYNRKNPDLTRVKADIQLSSAALIKAFETNEKQANDILLDKIIEVSGTVKEINKDEKGFYTIVIGEDNSMSSVRCSMDSTHHEKAAGLQTGNPIVLKGICTGFTSDEMLGSDVILNRSVIHNKK